MSAKDKNWTVYLLKCVDESIYTGITINLEARLQKHNSGKASKYTRSRLPVVLLKKFDAPNKNTALKMELKIKSLSHFEKINLSLETYVGMLEESNV